MSMNVIRCKDCVPYIEKQQLCFINHSPMFFCGKGKAKKKMTMAECAKAAELLKDDEFFREGRYRSMNVIRRKGCVLETERPLEYIAAAMLHKSLAYVLLRRGRGG